MGIGEIVMFTLAGFVLATVIVTVFLLVTRRNQ